MGAVSLLFLQKFPPSGGSGARPLLVSRVNARYLTVMKKHLLPISFLLFFSSLSLLRADNIILNSVQTPDDVSSHSIVDLVNSGEVTGSGLQGRVSTSDQVTGTLTIGDGGSPEVPGRIWKFFLLFRLPELQGKTVGKAALRLYLAHMQKEGPASLPPAWLFHAESWDDEKWTADPRWHGLISSDFQDTEKFSKKMPLCGSDDKELAFIDLDVTDWIRSDYKRGGRPLAVFRMEVSDQQTLDISDHLYNTYSFCGPAMMDRPDMVPSLTLTLE